MVCDDLMVVSLLTEVWDFYTIPDAFDLAYRDFDFQQVWPQNNQDKMIAVLEYVRVTTPSLSLELTSAVYIN